uniref:Uncharacterized protein n=1 Tax=viral metagenome TaxID=1070528 RepID=A0A6M3IE94_9ZZZZ
MPKYKLYLSGGRTKVLKAKTPLQAKYKYYGSDDHFKTERGVLRAEKYKKKR